MDKLQAHDDDTLGSGSGSASGYSDLTGLENETDTLGKRILQHQRDAQRLKHAIYGSQQAFKRRREEHHSKVGMDRNGFAGEVENRRELQRRIYDINDPDFPVTVPREWGRKGKISATWMRKIQQPSEPGVDEQDNGLRTADDYAVRPYRTVDTEINESQRSKITGDKSLQFVNYDISPPKHDFSSPSSLRHMNTTLRLSQEYDEHDFSSISLLASTPAPSRLPRRIDEIVRHKADDARPNGASKISNRNPATISRLRTPAFDGNFDPATPEKHLQKVHIAPVASPSRIPRRAGSPSYNKENQPPLGSVNGGPKNAQIVPTMDQAIQPVNSRVREHRSHQRDDSLALLRKLARVSSMSPNPARSLDQPDHPGSNKKDGDGSFKTLEPERIDVVVDIKNEIPHIEIMSDARSYDADETKHAESAPEASLDVRPESSSNGARTDVNVEVIDEAHISQPSDQEDGSVSKKTGTSTASSREETRSLARSYGLDLPRSALEDIVRDAKVKGIRPKYGESTIQSLEDIISPNLDPSEPTVTGELGNESQQQNQEPQGSPGGRRRLTQAEKDRRQENLAMEAMNKHLRAARTSLKDANRGLRRVENKVDTVHEDSVANLPKIRTNSTPEQCTTCSRSHSSSTSIWYGLWLEFRNLFYMPEISIAPKSWPRIQLTTLGFILLLVCVWFITESTLCAYYCHPLYASYMIDYGVDPDAPDFPFVIPTLALRPFRPIWKALWDTIVASGAVLLNNTSSSASSYTTDPTTSIPTIITTIAKTSRRIVLPRASGTTGEDGVSTSWRAAFTTTAWLDTAARTTARVAASVVDAVDGMGNLWEDDLIL